MGPLKLPPASTVLNYGQPLFEGRMKAFVQADGNIDMVTLPCFDPNGMLLVCSKVPCVSLCRLYKVPTYVFVGAADAVVHANAQWVPQYGKGALNLRLLLMGTGEGLGVKPSSATTCCIYCSLVGNYFKGDLKAIHLQAVRGFSRAAPGGSGAMKASGNYAPTFLVQKQVRARGLDEALCLDAVSGEAMIEEAGASDLFAVFPNHTIVTPLLDHSTILPGVTTRVLVMQLAEKECGCTVREGHVTLDD